MKKVKTDKIVGSAAQGRVDARDASSQPKEIATKNIKVKASIKAGWGSWTSPYSTY